MPSSKAGAQKRRFAKFDKFAQALTDFSNQQRYGHFPELTIEQNRVIWEAREKGWDVFWPSYPNAMSQAENTHKGAVEFLKSLS